MIHVSTMPFIQSKPTSPKRNKAYITYTHGQFGIIPPVEYLNEQWATNVTSALFNSDTYRLSHLISELCTKNKSRHEHCHFRCDVVYMAIFWEIMLPPSSLP
jgi:hypothetical protein